MKVEGLHGQGVAGEGEKGWESGALDPSLGSSLDMDWTWTRQASLALWACFPWDRAVKLSYSINKSELRLGIERSLLQESSVQ